MNLQIKTKNGVPSRFHVIIKWQECVCVLFFFFWDLEKYFCLKMCLLIFREGQPLKLPETKKTLLFTFNGQLVIFV